MIKKSISIGLSLLFLLPVLPVRAATVQECKEDVIQSLESVMGVPGRTELVGYIQQLDDLMSTSLPSYLLVDEVQQLARDARVELRGICRELEGFESMSEFYVAAYGLNSCQQLDNTNSETAGRLEIINFCYLKTDDLLNGFLDSLRQYLLKQAIRTSIEPVVQRMRSLNERLIVLVSDYSRLVNNFYTFSFRLGDTIIGERD
jgi:hypothetical protein